MHSRAAGTACSSTKCRKPPCLPKPRRRPPVLTELRPGTVAGVEAVCATATRARAPQCLGQRPSLLDSHTGVLHSPRCDPLPPLGPHAHGDDIAPVIEDLNGATCPVISPCRGRLPIGNLSSACRR